MIISYCNHNQQSTQLEPIIMSEDYAEYRQFLKNFEHTVNPNDQLPVRFGGYNITKAEVTGEVIDWTIQYLTERYAINI